MSLKKGWEVFLYNYNEIYQSNERTDFLGIVERNGASNIILSTGFSFF